MSLLILLFSFQLRAQTQVSTLHCEILNAFSPVASETVQITNSDKNLFYEDIDFRMWLSRLSNDQYELEVFHKTELQRSYAKSFIRQDQDFISWTHWSREHLVEARCRLQNFPSSKWSTACISGQVREQNFKNLTVESIETFHLDKSCQKPFISLKTTGEVRLTAKSNQIDFTFSQAFINLKSESSVLDYNQRKVCGFSDWILNQERDVTGLKCALMNGTRPSSMPFAGQKKYGIYKIENEKLYYGQLTPESDASTPEKRPQDWNTKYYYEKSP